jgi:GT2 family glycosyltransferase
MRLAARLRAAVRRPRAPSAAERWGAYLSAVEPALAAAPRVHRFAAPPVVGEPATEAEPIAVWIGGDPDGDPARRTRAAIDCGEVGAAELGAGGLADALAANGTGHVLLLRAGDEPAPAALERFGQALRLAPDVDVVTCDEDGLDGDGARCDPHFRPGPSPDRWLASDTGGEALLVRREAAGRVLGQLGDDPAWRHELLLRLAGASGERAAHVPFLLCHRGAGAGTPPPGLEAVRRLLAEREPKARVEVTGGIRRIRRPVEGEPEIEVVVCLRDKPELLHRCVDSLLSTTAYERLRVALVNNGSVEPATHELLARYGRDPRIRVLHDPRPFNFAALNNAAAAGSNADALVFLNNDTEVVQADWAEVLLEEAMRPEVGAVAPLLLYPDGTVQHAGAALGLHGYAGHPFAGLAPERETPFGRADGGTRNWLAVTAACMMVQRATFEAIGGFDESFVVAGNDVELCLRLTAAGHRSLCVPHAVLLHDESRSRGAHIDPADFVRSEQSYGSFRTVGDPFYNPNLTLEATDCGVRRPGEPRP